MLSNATSVHQKMEHASSFVEFFITFLSVELFLSHGNSASLIEYINIWDEW